MAWRRKGGDSPHRMTHGGRPRSWRVLAVVAVPAVLWGGLLARRTDVANSALADEARTWAGLGVVAAAFLVVYAAGRLRNRPHEHVRAASAKVLTADAPAHPVLVHPVVELAGRSVRLHLEISDEHDELLGHVLVHPLPGFDPRAPWWLVGDPVPGRPLALVAESQHQVVLASSLLEPGPAPSVPWSELVVGLVGWGYDAEHPEHPERGEQAHDAVPADGAVHAVPAAEASPGPTAPIVPPALDLLEHPVARWRRSRARWRWVLALGVLVAFGVPIAVEVPPWAPLVLVGELAALAALRLWVLRRHVLALAARQEPELDPTTMGGRSGGPVARALVGWGRPPTAPPTWTDRLPLATR